MGPNVLQVAQIFEDPEPARRFRTGPSIPIPNAEDVVRGRRKENISPSRSQAPLPHEPVAATHPLGERHINASPQPKRVPTKTADGSYAPSRPRHKKTASSISLKGLLLGKEKTGERDGDCASDEPLEQPRPKKVKSATNLTGLLKKKSKKDLKETTTPTQEPDSLGARSPLDTTNSIWAQFATQPLEGADGTMLYPLSKRRTVEEEIRLYTPKDHSEFRPAEQRNFYGCDVQRPSMDYPPPTRPYLDPRASRSSIFTENLDEEGASELQRPQERPRHGRPPSPSCAREPQKWVESRSTPPSVPDPKAKRASKMLHVVQSLNLRSRREPVEDLDAAKATAPRPSPQEIDSAFEKVLDSLNIPLNMRDNMRNLKPDVKAGLMKGDRAGSGSSGASSADEPLEIRSSARSPAKGSDPKSRGDAGNDEGGKRSRSRSRPRSRILTLSKRDNGSPEKPAKPESSSRSRSKSRHRSVDLTSPRPDSSRGTASTLSLAAVHGSDSATTPGDFIHYLREVQKPALVDVGKLHKLRILLRNESVHWTDHFVTRGGMDELIQLYYRITQIEWREEHDDNLLHETLLCLKGLCTTALALQRLQQVETEFFPVLLNMLFDPERKGPSEFNTRAVIVALLFAHLRAVVDGAPAQVHQRARFILGVLRDPVPEEARQPLEFVSRMHVARPYRVWAKEVVNVTKEVFWIFLHHLNVVPIAEADPAAGYTRAHFPAPRPPHPAAPYVGGVEWEATQYLATHLDLLNGLIAALPTVEARNALREDLRQSSFEKVMGGSLRTCKEKFYAGVHEGLKCWVSAAHADGWPVEDVRAGPPREASSPRKSPCKKKSDEPPQLALDIGLGPTAVASADDGGWI